MTSVKATAVDEGHPGGQTTFKCLTFPPCQVEKSDDGRFWMASATAIVRVALGNGCGHEDVGNAHLKDRDKGEVLQRVKKVGVCY